MTDAPLTKATVTIPGGLIISLEGPSSEEVMKMLDVIIQRFPGAASAPTKRRNSRQGKHVYNPEIEQEIVRYSEGNPDGFLFGDMRAHLQRAEPLVRMALDNCLAKGNIVVANDHYREGRFGPFTVLYSHINHKKGK